MRWPKVAMVYLRRPRQPLTRHWERCRHGAMWAVGLMALLGAWHGTGLAQPQGPLTIFTATSLTDAFKEIAASIEQANPGTHIEFNFAGSPTLRTQLAQGARADVFASADEPNMYAAKQDGTIASEPQIFARNLLVVVVPANNPAGIKSLQDLTRPAIKLILANKQVPVGHYARQALAKMSQDPAFGSDFADRVLQNLVSEETNAKQVAAKVQLGEADAGVVYATDVTPAIRQAVQVINIPPEFNVIARYPIAVVKGARHPEGARFYRVYSFAGGADDPRALWLPRRWFLTGG